MRKNARRGVLQYIRRNWFDVGTTVWAISLLVAATLWMAGPAFAYAGGTDCFGACQAYCEDMGGCDTYIPGGPNCPVECMDGTSETLPCTT